MVYQTSVNPEKQAISSVELSLQRAVNTLFFFSYSTLFTLFSCLFQLSVHIKIFPNFQSQGQFSLSPENFPLLWPQNSYSMFACVSWY